MGDLYVGVMSGTSFDGVDLVLLEIEHPFRARQLAFGHEAFPGEIKETLLHAVAAEAWHPSEWLALHDALGRYFGEAVARFIEGHTGHGPVRAIGLHGLTLWHLPERHRVGGLWGSGTLQIGNPSQVRAITGIPTIYDFRSADMALGGQGAPLVPFLDRLLFADPVQGRMALNLGGIANVTFLPPGGGPVIAFDTGPSNMLIDLLMAKHPESPALFDEGGRCAARGRVVPELLARCKSDPYFKRLPPKSTGRERFGSSFLHHFESDVQHHSYDDLVATATRLTAETIADAIQLQMARMVEYGSFDLLITAGGGVHNPAMMAMLAECLPNVEMTTTESFGVPPDGKEAWLMAALAWAHLEGVPGNLPTVTGASREVVLGASTR